MAEMKLSRLAELVGGQLVGDGQKVVRGVASLEAAEADQVAFLANQRYEKFVATTHAAAVIVANDFDGAAGPGAALIRCSDPYFSYRQAMVAFYGFRKHPFSGIDKRSNIDSSAKLAINVSIAAFATVCAGTRIGEGSVVYPGVFVGPRCRIGRDCILYPNVTLYDGTVLGDRVTVHAGSSIGHDGFGYATHKGDDGVVRHEKIPQAGWVELEDDVEIGAGCTIDRATMGATVIGAGTKFSNLIAIGHGTRMGKHGLMVAQSGIAGSVQVGNYCIFAGQSGVVGHIKIGDGVQVAAQAGVTEDVPPGQQVGGSPAEPLAQARRVWMSIRRLPQMRTAVQKLTREMIAIKRRLGLHGDEIGEGGSQGDGR